MSARSPNPSGGSLRRTVVPSGAWVWISLAVAVGLPGVYGGCGRTRETPAERIVLIVVDTLRADHVGAYGGRWKTPRIDALAARGQVFSHALAAFHQTSMSMGAMFTGLPASLESGDPGHPLSWNQGTFCGMARFRSAEDPGCLPDAVTTVAEDLSAAGYWTAAVTANPLLFRPYGYDQGFDRWIEVGDVPSGNMRLASRRRHARSRAGEFVNRAVFDLLRERESDHFFLYVHYLDVHDWILLKRPYEEGVELEDRLVGRLLDFLGAEGLLDDCVVIVTADHGEWFGGRHPITPLGGHGGNPSYEPVLEVPLIVAPPRFDDTDRTVRGFDLRDMLRALAGLPRTSAPRDAASRGEPDELLVTEVLYRTYRRGRYKSLWPRAGGDPLLFDLDRDPDETDDVASEHPDVVAAHRARVESLTRALSAGPVPLPELSPADEQRLRALGYME